MIKSPSPQLRQAGGLIIKTNMGGMRCVYMQLVLFIFDLWVQIFSMRTSGTLLVGYADFWDTPYRVQFRGV